MKTASAAVAWYARPATHGATASCMLLGIALALAAEFALRDAHLGQWILWTAVGLAAVPLLVGLAGQLAKGNFSVDLLALLSMGTALVLRQPWVAAIVVLMLSGGQTLESFATARASSVLHALAKRMPRVAHRVGPGDGQGLSGVEDTAIETIAAGDRLLLFPHEICPVDGVVTGGRGSMDESYLTGEPYEISKAPGATVLSGSINGSEALTIRATKLAGDSRYAKIVEVLHASEENRPSIQRLGDRLGSWYTPLAVAIALLSWLVSGQAERFLAVLVIATPCPLLISIPVAIIAAISVGARRGIVIKDPSVLEKLATCRVLIVDKTGTLTYGKPNLTEIDCLHGEDERRILQRVASLERYSKHPLAGAVLEKAEREGVPLLEAADVSESPGAGLTGHVDGHLLCVTGRGKLGAAAADLPSIASGLECVVVMDGQPAAVLRFEDLPRSESEPFVHHLGPRHAIREVILLSGDRPAEVAKFAQGIGIAEAHGGKSPEEKVAFVREKTAKARTLYLGDGINDAPAMLAATVGIALGVNSDITSEAAGAVILQSSLTGVDELLHIGRRMRAIALTSAVGGMGLSILGMGAAAMGWLSPIEGALAQEAIDLLSILNSLRMLLPAGSLVDFAITRES